MTPSQLKKALLEKRHIATNGCWEWTGCLINGHTRTRAHTYGQMRTGVKTRELVHRVSFRVFVGKIPPGKVVMHLCDNGPCFNPEHLSVGTYQDNTVDAMEKGRFHGAGRKSPLWTMEVGTSMEFSDRDKVSATTYIGKSRGIRFSVRQNGSGGCVVYALPLKVRVREQAPSGIKFNINAYLYGINNREAWKVLETEKERTGAPFVHTIRAALQLWSKHNHLEQEKAA